MQSRGGTLFFVELCWPDNELALQKLHTAVGMRSRTILSAHFASR